MTFAALGEPAGAAHGSDQDRGAGQGLHRRHARRPAHHPPAGLQHPHRVPRCDPQADPGQPPGRRPPSLLLLHLLPLPLPRPDKYQLRQRSRQQHQAATVPRCKSPATAPTHMLQPAQPQQKTRPLPSSGASVARPAAAIKSARPRHQPGLTTFIVATYLTSRGCSCNPGTPTPIKRRSSLHEPATP